MTMDTKREIFKEKLEAYLSGSKETKGHILDAVCSVTGYNRKAAIRRFHTLQNQPRRQKRRGRKTTYGYSIIPPLRELWNMSGRICAERLHPQIPEYIRVLSRDKMWRHGQEETALLLKARLATLKRRIGLFERIKKGGGRSTTKPSDLKEIIPVRRGPWQNPLPGWGEVDTVAHCGWTIAGDFAYTVQYTDVATIWTCLAAQWQKGEEATVRSMERIRERLPFLLRGIDPDSGSEFINWHLKGWCDARGIKMTRTRPYMKNDHARIEQKNYQNIRHVVGYARYDDPRQVAILNQFYDALEDHINFFVPSMKCLRKERVLSKTVRVYDLAQTAYARALACPGVAPETKEKLRQKYATLNPLILKQKCDRMVEKLQSIRPRLR